MCKELKDDYVNTVRHFRFLILFTAVFFLGSLCIYIAGILLLSALVLGLRDTWEAAKKIMLHISYHKRRHISIDQRFFDA